EEDDLLDVEALLHKPEHASGTPIVSGIVQGVVALQNPPSAAHPTFAKDVAEEKTRLSDAVATVQKSVDNMMATDRGLEGASREVLEVFRLFAYDKGWVRRIEEKVLLGLSAESATEQVQAENRQRMRQVSDPYLRERLHDLDDLSRRLLRVLSGEEMNTNELPANAVYLADSLGPVELLELDASKLKGIVLAEGAATSHAAIVARSLGVPMISGAPEIVDRANFGDVIVMDGGTGEVHLRPPDTVITTFEDKAQLRLRRLAGYTALKDEPAITKDGVEIDLQMNAGLLLDMAHMDETGAGSIGLFRTELQFLLGRSLPTAADQETFYSQILDAANGRPVTFRTADIGSDKRAPYMRLLNETNPAMGWRGLRIAIDREGLMRTQIRALLSAAKGRSLRFMLPLVTTVHEIEEARLIIDKEKKRHEKRVGPLPTDIQMGAMVEIPSAAWDIKKLASHVDFLSVGGNDLAQFFFAADRDSEIVGNRYDPLAPSFLSFLKRTVQEAKSAGKPLGYCGEQAADPLMTLALLAIGVERLSVAASAIGSLKAMIRSVTFTRLRDEVLRLVEKGEATIRPELRAFAK
ncbi:MAG: phosphoenolpyruvate--protein phosphotransferase, partial [Pseudomonadota bacterium]